MLFYEIMTPEEEEILLEKIQRAEAMQAQSPLKGANADTLFDRDEPRYESQSDQDPEPSESLIDNSGIPLSDLPIEDPGIDDVDDELPPRSPETPQTSPEPEESPNEPSRAEEWSSPPQVVSDSQTEELNGYLRQRVQNKKRKNNPPENDNNSNDPPSSVPKSPLVLVN